jgi:hypothetical protein
MRDDRFARMIEGKNERKTHGQGHSPGVQYHLEQIINKKAKRIFLILII